MSDDLNDEQIALASAYLDDDVTPAERAQVEDTPELIAAVERLRAVRVSLADTEVPAISMRERHLAGALDAWDRLPEADRRGEGAPDITAAADPAAAAGAATVTAPTPLSEQRETRARKQRSGWLLTAAAVVLVVAGAGLIVSGALSDSDDDVAGDATEIQAQREQLNAEAAADETFEEQASAAEEAEVVEEILADERFEEPAEVGAVDLDAGRPDTDFVIDSPEALADFARTVLAEEERVANEAIAAAETVPALSDQAEATADDTPAAAPADLTCGLVDRIIGEVEYGGGLYPPTAAVGVDANETEAIAYLPDTCAVVARTGL